MVFFPFIPWWWVEPMSLAIAAVVIMITVRTEDAKIATWWVAIMGAASFFSGGQIYYLFTHPTLYMGLIALGYLVAGIVWSLAHWGIWMRDKAEWLKNHSSKKENTYSAAVSDYTLQANVGRVVSWIFYWPFDIPATLLFGPLKRFGQWCVKSLGGVYNSIAEHMLRKYLLK